LSLLTPTRLKRSSLKDARPGARVRVLELKSEPAVCHRLREMGFCEFAEISKVCDHGPCICTVCGTRVALSSQLAESIMVREIDEPSRALAVDELAPVPAPFFS
jgi:ferrous iron transport protein A